MLSVVVFINVVSKKSQLDMALFSWHLRAKDGKHRTGQWKGKPMEQDAFAHIYGRVREDTL